MAEYFVTETVGEVVDQAMQVFEGVRVVDSSRLLPGGHAGMVLAGFGAEVPKVEPPPYGDGMRAAIPKQRGVGRCPCSPPWPTPSPRLPAVGSRT